MPIACTPASLMTASAWFDALDTKHQLMADVYALAEMVGVPVNAESMMKEAACFEFLTEKQLLQVQVRELCDLVNL